MSLKSLFHISLLWTASLCCLILYGIATLYISLAYDLPDARILKTSEGIATLLDTGPDGERKSSPSIRALSFDGIPPQVLDAFQASMGPYLLADDPPPFRDGCGIILPHALARKLLGSANLRTYSRILKQGILAWHIHISLSPEEMFAAWVSTVYLGNGNFGLVEAVDFYFSKQIAELTIAEAAVLASIPFAPTKFNPLKHPELISERRAWVLGRMRDYGMITPEELAEALASPLIQPRTKATRNP